MAGIRSVAVGLARTLRVGEFVELVDVGLGNHDVDGGEHEWAPRGIVSVIVSLLDEAGDRPAVSYVECANAGGVGATLRFKQEKRLASLAASSGG